jgi:tetratricopeptide (TPR) repeat protein
MEIFGGQDDPEAAFHRANTLLGENRFEEALAELERASQTFKGIGDLGTAAFYTNVKGSFLASRQRNEEALAEFLRAERTDPEDSNWRLSTAHHFLRLGRAEEARVKALEILDRDNQEPGTAHLAYSYLGLAELALGHDEQACEAFLGSIADDVLSHIPASNYHLGLAEELIARGLEVSHAFNYLSRARPREDT